MSFPEVLKGTTATPTVGIYDLFLKVYSKFVAATKVALNVKMAKTVSVV